MGWHLQLALCYALSYCVAVEALYYGNNVTTRVGQLVRRKQAYLHFMHQPLGYGHRLLHRRDILPRGNGIFARHRTIDSSHFLSPVEVTTQVAPTTNSTPHVEEKTTESATTARPVSLFRQKLVLFSRSSSSSSSPVEATKRIVPWVLSSTSSSGESSDSSDTSLGKLAWLSKESVSSE